LQKELLQELAGLEEALNYATAESLQVRLRRPHVQRLLVSFVSALSSVNALELLSRRKPEALESLRQDLGEWARTALDESQSHETLVQGLRTLEKQLQDSAPSGSLSTRARTRDLAQELIRILEISVLLDAEKSGRSLRPAGYVYRDWGTAGRAFGRSVIGVAVAGLIWQWTGWHNGPFLVMIAAVNVGLFSTRLDPSQGVRTTIRSSLLAYLAAFICQITVSSIPSLWTVFAIPAPFLFAAGIIMAQAVNNLAAAIFSVNFLMFYSPHWPMTFDLQKFLDLGLAYFAGSFFSLLAFRLIAAPSPTQRIQKIENEIVQDLRKIASDRFESRADLWDTLMSARIAQLMQLTTGQPNSVAFLRRGLVTLNLGRQLLKTRQSPELQNIHERERLVRAFAHFPQDVDLTRRELALAPSSVEIHELQEAVEAWSRSAQTPAQTPGTK